MNTPPVSSTANESVIALARVVDAHGAASRVDGADDAARGDEPEAAGPVGQRGDDPVVRAAPAVESTSRSSSKPGVGRLRDDEQVPVGGRQHRAVAVVEVEVAAAGEVVERAGARRRGGRGGRSNDASVLERPRVHQRQHRAVEPDADRHDPPARVERHRRALAPLEHRRAAHLVAERPGARIGVGHVRVVVDVASGRSRAMNGCCGASGATCAGCCAAGAADELGASPAPLGDRRCGPALPARRRPGRAARTGQAPHDGAAVERTKPFRRRQQRGGSKPAAVSAPSRLPSSSPWTSPLRQVAARAPSPGSRRP